VERTTRLWPCVSCKELEGAVWRLSVHRLLLYSFNRGPFNERILHIYYHSANLSLSLEDARTSLSDDACSRKKASPLIDKSRPIAGSTEHRTKVLLIKEISLSRSSRMND